MQALKIGILGITGRMGHMIQEAIKDDELTELIGGTSRNTPAADLDALFEKADVLIDFTNAAQVATHLGLAKKYKTPFVMGTTGLTDVDFTLLNKISTDLPCFYAPNMSTGITLLLHLVEQASASLSNEFDIEISETHHRHKADAPSGTALNFGKAAAQGRQVNFDEVKQLNWTTDTPRKRGLIGFSANRGGQVIGDHKVSFYGDDEIIDLTHRAQNRMIYAKGAVTAAKWIIKQPAGLYNMRDLLRL